MRVIIFGVGEKYLQNRHKFLGMKIVAYLDNDTKKQGAIIDGIYVDTPDNIDKYSYDYVLITSIYYESIRRQLLELGVSGQKILDKRNRGGFSNIRNVIEYNVKSNNDRKRITLISHDLSLTGAPLMLFNMAAVLVECGWYVEIFSKSPGELLYEYIQNGISVKIVDDYDFTEDEIEHYFSRSDLIVINTLTLYETVNILGNLGIPIIWWLHEEENIYSEYRISKSDLHITNNIYPYGVGKRVIDCFKAHFDKEINNLLYGIPYDNRGISKKKKDCKIVFAVIGVVCERKGQDIFIEAIKKNWESWKDVAEFWILGQVTNDIRNIYLDTGMVKVFGELEHNEVMEKFKYIDVVVCPSRNDPMPVVITEGMMNEKICIVSDMTGSSNLIVPYENGLICKAGDSNSLANEIQWVIDHFEDSVEIGGKAYKLYEKNFSMKLFKENIISIVEEKIL